MKTPNILPCTSVSFTNPVLHRCMSLLITAHQHRTNKIHSKESCNVNVSFYYFYYLPQKNTTNSNNPSIAQLCNQLSKSISRIVLIRPTNQPDKNQSPSYCRSFCSAEKVRKRKEMTRAGVSGISSCPVLEKDAKSQLPCVSNNTNKTKTIEPECTCF